MITRLGSRAVHLVLALLTGFQQRTVRTQYALPLDPALANRKPYVSSAHPRVPFSSRTHQFKVSESQSKFANAIWILQTHRNMNGAI